MKLPEKTEHGVGTEVHKILNAMGFEPTPHCKCLELQAQWDKNGIQWCKLNKVQLVRAIKEEADARGFLSGAVAKYGGASVVVNRAIANAAKDPLSVP